MRRYPARKSGFPSHHTGSNTLEDPVWEVAGIDRNMDNGRQNVERTRDKGNEQNGFNKRSHIYNVFLSKELQPVETGCVALRVIPPMSPCMKFIAILAVWHIAG